MQSLGMDILYLGVFKSLRDVLAFGCVLCGIGDQIYIIDAYFFAIVKAFLVV